MKAKEYSREATYRGYGWCAGIDRRSHRSVKYKNGSLAIELGAHTMENTCADR